MAWMGDIVDVIGQALLATLGQSAALLGPFFVLGAVLWLLQRAISRIYLQRVGWRALLWTAWIGTPVHEASHALLAIIFGHRIIEIKFFAPDPRTGVLGYVRHSYNSKNLYQSIGNFFIGGAPLIIGALALYAALLLLAPNSHEVMRAVQSGAGEVLRSHTIVEILTGLRGMAVDTFACLFTVSNLQSLQFWLFVYLSLGIATHLAPSPTDMGGVAGGLAVFLGALFIINTAGVLLRLPVTHYIFAVNHYTSMLLPLLLYAVIVLAAHLVVSFAVLSVILRKA